ncbi:UNVERIFIED_CONTAM: hypothetical protein GTU68_008775 [Idotea baltica]|nr:hypothetical protein [Idotea baltica]
MSVAIGAAQAKKLNNDSNLVYSLHGDGELQEGQNWEAIMYASGKKVDNLIATIDLNGQQIDGATDDVLPMGNIRAKFEAFGWDVLDIKEGNDLGAILKGMQEAKSRTGITLGEDGATHQILEDIGMMKMLPGMVVINPCDFNQTKAATLAIAEYEGPVYLRFGRPKVANFTPVDQKFEIGKALMLNEGSDVTIIATGHLVWESLIAAENLEKQGISAEVINIHTIKPLDKEAVLKSVKKTGCVVTAEEHNYMGGLGESIARVLANQHPAPQEFVATQDTFGESGTPEQLMEKYGLNNKAIEKAVLKVVKRK